MNKLKIVFLFLIGFIGINLFSQTDSLEINSVKITPKSTPITRKITWNTDPLSPSKAAFYSAILPGLGQIYNKSYWKVPLVYGAIGTSLYFYQKNSKEFDRYRNAYKRRLDGFTDDEFFGDRSDGRPRVSEEGLRRAQQFYKRNKELSLLFVVATYALNIIEANVDAHLKQYNIDENLSVEPYADFNQINGKTTFGLTLNMKF